MHLGGSIFTLVTCFCTLTHFTCVLCQVCCVFVALLSDIRDIQWFPHSRNALSVFPPFLFTVSQSPAWNRQRCVVKGIRVCPSSLQGIANLTKRGWSIGVFQRWWKSAFVFSGTATGQCVLYFFFATWCGTSPPASVASVAYCLLPCGSDKLLFAFRKRAQEHLLRIIQFP